MKKDRTMQMGPITLAPSSRQVWLIGLLLAIACGLASGQGNRVGAGAIDEVLFPQNAPTDQAAESSDNPAVSADGRWIAFSTRASNLVPDDTNGVSDIFVYDRETETIERASVDSVGGQAEDDVSHGQSSRNAALNADGRFVGFESTAVNLVPGDSNGIRDVFVRDREQAVTERVSVDSNGVSGNNESWCPALSADGNVVAFVSLASNLVADDTNNETDVFVHDRRDGTTTRVSVSSAGDQLDRFGAGCPGISADGRYVGFWSRAPNLVPGDTNSFDDMFVHDRQSGVTERISVDSNGNQANGSSSFKPALSADGRIVAFRSTANNLVFGDRNNRDDVFVHDRQTGFTERASVDSIGNEGNTSSTSPGLSADGRLVFFSSTADNLVPNDTNEVGDVFVHDRDTGATERLSVDTGGGQQSNGSTFEPAPSADGVVVAFASVASNLVLGDTNQNSDIFVIDRDAETIEQVSRGDPTVPFFAIGDLWNPALSGDGEVVAFTSGIATLVVGDNNESVDVFTYDRTTELIEAMSVDASGQIGNGDTYISHLSGDGRLVVMTSNADNLVANDSNERFDVFVRDRQLKTNLRVSVDSEGRQANDGSSRANISADGRFVVYVSDASNLVANDNNNSSDIFVHELSTGSTERVSVSSAAVQANSGSSERPAISADGRFISFSSEASNLVAGDTNGVADVFLHDRQTGSTERVNIDSDGDQANDFSFDSRISANGRFVAFSSLASNLVRNDTNAASDVLVHDRQTGITERVTLDVSGQEFSVEFGLPYLNMDMSADGRFVVFRSLEFGNSRFRIFLRDLANNRTQLLANDEYFIVNDDPVISADGKVVAYQFDSSQVAGARTIALHPVPDIPIDPVDETPQARLLATSVSGPAPMTLRFDGSLSSDDQGINIYRFDFDDGQGTFSDQSIVEHTYSESGEYDVLLKVIDTQGNFGVARVRIAVALGGAGGAQSPVSSFTAIPVSGDAPLTVRFDGSASTDDQAIAIYRFDFGDGSGSYGQSSMVEHRYDRPGTYQVALKVTDDVGNTDFTKVTVMVASINDPIDGTPPVARATASPTSGAAPLTVRFDGSGSSDDQGIAVYRFDFGDFSGTYDDRPIVEHVYREPGEYHAALEVLDAQGNSDVVLLTITVAGP